jgi:hypothetical protein
VKGTRHALASVGAPPDAAGPPLRHPCLAFVVVINPSRGNVALAEQQERQPRPCSSTPLGSSSVPMLEGSLSRHAIPSPPPPPQSPSPLSSPKGPARRHHFETWVIPGTPAIDQVEEAHGNSLMAVDRGTWQAVTLSQVVQLLSQHYVVQAGDVSVKRYNHPNFLLVFTSRQLANQVLHMPPWPDVEFRLIF